MEQVHKRFTDGQVKSILERYELGKIGRREVELVLGIKKAQFFRLIKSYREDAEKFSIEYRRKEATRKIPEKIEENIFKELEMDKGLIENPNTLFKKSQYVPLTVK